MRHNIALAQTNRELKSLRFNKGSRPQKSSRKWAYDAGWTVDLFIMWTLRVYLLQAQSIDHESQTWDNDQMFLRKNGVIPNW